MPRLLRLHSTLSQFLEGIMGCIIITLARVSFSRLFMCPVQHWASDGHRRSMHQGSNFSTMKLTIWLIIPRGRFSSSAPVHDIAGWTFGFRFLLRYSFDYFIMNIFDISVPT